LRKRRGEERGERRGEEQYFGKILSVIFIDSRPPAISTKLEPTLSSD
jgi:hypothetical protein